MAPEPPVVEGVRHRWVEARGLRFHVAEAGEGDDVVPQPGGGGGDGAPQHARASGDQQAHREHLCAWGLGRSLTLRV